MKFSILRICRSTSAVLTGKLFFRFPVADIMLGATLNRTQVQRSLAWLPLARILLTTSRTLPLPVTLLVVPMQLLASGPILFLFRIYLTRTLVIPRLPIVALSVVILPVGIRIKLGARGRNSRRKRLRLAVVKAASA